MRPDPLLCRLALGLPILFAGCAGPPTGATVDGGSDRVAAMVGPTSVGWAALEAPLAELAGAAVLEEVALDLLLADELRRAGLTIGSDDIAAERRDLAASLVRAGGSTGRGAGALERLFEQRGLGPNRLERLLRRNAALRALTRGSVGVSDDEVRLSHALSYGPRLRVRLYTNADQRAAAAAQRAVANATVEQRASVITTVVAADSAHPSRDAGGLLPPVHSEDPGVPAVIRREAEALTPGSVSGLFAVGEAFGFVLLEAGVPAVADAPSIEAVRAEITRELRRRKERLAMDRLAARLLAESDIRAVDPSLGWSLDAAR